MDPRERHSLLRRQLKKHLASDARVPTDCAAFLDAVDAAYRESDEDRLMLERAFELASQELLDANAQLRAAKESAEAANLAKRRFLSGMSHELRTPLYAILGYAELLEEEVGALRRPELAAEVASIRAAGDHLLTLINGLLDFARIEAGRQELTVEDFDLDALLADLLAIMRPLADGNGNRLVVEKRAALGRMRTDPTKVRQILLNLLGNANKFTARGTLTVTGAAAGDGVVLSVSDTGIGIDAERQRALFEPFTRIETPAGKQYPGTGLGLAITREYCRALGGSIEFVSAPGRGSTFTARLPRTLPSAAAKTAAR
ncbi:MAG: HAMP domain-containing histidine kinase [Elusimicrobia bacterium]|nr:HAMP domain-containing histidine kinase [Elusimicrobiota bacterium]